MAFLTTSPDPLSAILRRSHLSGGWILLPLLVLLTTLSAWAQGTAPQAGTLDLSFDPGLAIAALPGATGPLGLVGLQPGGAVVVSYTTAEADGTHGHLARLNPDGSLAASTPFDAGAGAELDQAVVQPDGGVLVAYSFYTGATRVFDHADLLRLGPDLRPDTGFRPTFRLLEDIRALSLQPDGGTLVLGSFASEDGAMFGPLLRLLPNGRLDPGFRPAPPTTGELILSVAAQGDGKVLIGGYLQFHGTTLTAGARLNADGSQDASFRPVEIGTITTYARPRLDVLTPLPDGRTLLEGTFDSIDGISRGGLTRLNVDGSVDTGYSFGYSRATGAFVQPDARVLLYGYNSVIRLNADDSLDAGFSTGQGFSGEVFAQAVQPDGKVIVGGNLQSFSGVARPNVARFNADGSLDVDFFADVSGSMLSAGVQSVALQADGGVLLAGDFRRVNGSAHAGLARLRADGGLDGGFQGNLEGGDYVAASLVRVLPDGNLLVAGNFTTVNGVPRAGLARLHADGSVDESFDPAPAAAFTYYPETTVLPQPDGKVLVSGNNIRAIGGVPRAGLARLNTDGSLDAGYDPGNNPAFTDVRLAAVTADGKALIFADIPQANGTVASTIVRLNADGSVDGGFRLADDQFPGLYHTFRSINPLPDGRLLASVFLSLSGPQGTLNRLVRFNADGSLDPTFQAVDDANPSAVLVPVPQADGELIVRGLNGLTRLHADGSQDPGFVFRQGVEGSVSQVAVQVDGNVLIGGSFTRVQGMARPGLARLLGATPPGAPARPTVNVAVDRPTISRGAGEATTVTFTRTGDDLSRTIKVVYHLDGLNNGVDYAGVPAVKKIKAGKPSASIQVRPLPGGANGKVKLTVLPGVGYDVGTANRVKVKVSD